MLFMWLGKLLLTTFLFFSVSAISNAEINIALLESYPWSFQGKDGEIKGIYPDLLKKVQTNINTNINFLNEVKLEIHLHPMARIQHDMSTNSYTDLTIMSFKPKRKLIMRPLEKIYRTPFILLSRAKDPIHTIEELAGKRLAVLQGGSGCPCLEGSSNPKKIYVNDHKHSLKMLLTNRSDAVAGPAIRLLGNVSALGFKDKIAVPVIYEWREVWLWANNSYLHEEGPVVMGAGKLRDIDAFLFEFKKLIMSGAIREIAALYLTGEQLEYVYDE